MVHKHNTPSLIEWKHFRGIQAWLDGQGITNFTEVDDVFGIAFQVDYLDRPIRLACSADSTLHRSIQTDQLLQLCSPCEIQHQATV